MDFELLMDYPFPNSNIDTHIYKFMDMYFELLIHFQNKHFYIFSSYSNPHLLLWFSITWYTHLIS